MKEAYILDLNILAEQNLSIEEFMTLLKIKNSEIEFEIKDNVIKTLQDKQFIKIITEENEKALIIREKGLLLIDFLLIEGLDSAYKDKKITRRSSRSVNNDVNNFITEFRNLWKGLKPGSLGSLGGCRDKMTRWMHENPEYSREDILKAAKNYINSLDNYKYLQQADYFIYKKDLGGESSRLSAFIDEVEVKEEGWGSSLN